MDATGETIQLAMSLAEIFSGQVDFESDLQPGDTFEMLFEKSTHDGQFAGYGAILGARLMADGTRIPRLPLDQSRHRQGGRTTTTTDGR